MHLQVHVVDVHILKTVIIIIIIIIIMIIIIIITIIIWWLSSSLEGCELEVFGRKRDVVEKCVLQRMSL